ncbi:hypothetical protein A2773_06760 [Candidatus Gottesmanbacteria bacterium RIFCSPHIGHO2_01_FULL_39_10]|uniref:DNA-damage-inducible protein J n=1 Tax=Candidatus Gottesmanbacteria bacterium RIFCSPHIGHO2_01_FULL_39_10 TaxID=1798375 RepID=A0A1F5ZP69_9BACT|nr:MAG: hypothetical protein A2773_06760 [Candidatus Gottesmanbacteria bacterium RIFCSPHIGHO2_01_FULL_39_10]
MNTNTTLQVPISKNLKKKAKSVAKESGFSSLQDVVRLLLTKFAGRQIRIAIEETEVHLSPKNEKRYIQMDKDFDEGKNVYRATSVKDLMKKLNS